ncbi:MULTISPECIES: recombinase family protein [Streptomyces]|uniref:Resolvase n=1 Tax=Streptomyces dengpaensis TaxID=2049881 RepID=A0ABM6SUH6_9ACTN|nr:MULTISPECIES: recombinase family protein [Streptomyces]AVH58418.1 resolvase [Streptomyces dengpaensis]PIB06091.1 hypothetical protein B1C81_26285 [Streptomyces sp. HG99]
MLLPQQRPPADADDEPWLGYIRVSTWKEEKISPELQEEAIRRWAVQHGKRLLEPLVTDLDVSGRHFKRKITSAIERVEEGEARGVAVWRYSRFGRDRTGNAMWLARLERAGGQLESATEQIDATTAIGRFQRGMILEFGAFESDRAGEQWRETHEHRKYKLGLPAQGRKRAGYIWHRRRIPDPVEPEGFRLQKERYEIDSEYGRVIADLYRKYIDGTGFHALAYRLNSAGWRSTQGKLWSEQTVRRYMDGGFPAGLLRVHDPNHRCGKADGSCHQYVYIQGAHEELIGYELWEAYQKRRREVAATPPRARASLYELTGLVRCAQCRGGTEVKGGGNVTVGYAYQCSTRTRHGSMGCDGCYARRTVVEEKAFQWLKGEAAKDIDAAPETPVEDGQDSAKHETAQALRARTRLHAEVERQRQALANLRAERAADPDSFEPGEYEDAVATIRAKRQQAEAELAAMPAEVEPLPERSAYTELIADTVGLWPAMNEAEKNRLYHKVLRRVALVKHGSGTAGTEFQFHPVWEPDPWAK